MEYTAKDGEFVGFKAVTPTMITIPKSEYELLVQIKDKFLGGDHEQTH